MKTRRNRVAFRNRIMCVLLTTFLLFLWGTPAEASIRLFSKLEAEDAEHSQSDRVVWSLNQMVMAPQYDPLFGRTNDGSGDLVECLRSTTYALETILCGLAGASVNIYIQIVPPYYAVLPNARDREELRTMSFTEIGYNGYTGVDTNNRMRSRLVDGVGSPGAYTTGGGSEDRVLFWPVPATNQAGTEFSTLAHEIGHAGYRVDPGGGTPQEQARLSAFFSVILENMARRLADPYYGLTKWGHVGGGDMGEQPFYFFRYVYIPPFL